MDNDVRVNINTDPLTLAILQCYHSCELKLGQIHQNRNTKYDIVFSLFLVFIFTHAIFVLG